MRKITKSEAIKILQEYYKKFPNFKNPMEFFEDFFETWNDEYEGVIDFSKIYLFDKHGNIIHDIKFTIN